MLASGRVPKNRAKNSQGARFLGDFALGSAAHLPEERVQLDVARGAAQHVAAHGDALQTRQAQAELLRGDVPILARGLVKLALGPVEETSEGKQTENSQLFLRGPRV